MKILFATSEAVPLIKTGGLADISGSLPPALKALKHDVRVVLPAYRGVKKLAGKLRTLARVELEPGAQPATILEGRLPGSTIKLYLVDAPEKFDRPGGPYSTPDGADWPDNAQRFALFARAVVAIAENRVGARWSPDVVHCNDWQTGLVPALLNLKTPRPATVFTVHNLAFQGLFPWATFQALQLPYEWWSMHGLEFHGQCSFIKGGLYFADRITTVSPTYAAEIRTPAFGCGLEGLLETRAAHLTGILNGADYRIWNPNKDALIKHPYSARALAGKQRNKTALQTYLKLPKRADTPLLGHVGRLTAQKGIDLLLDSLPTLIKRDIQIAIVGTGDRALEKTLTAVHKKHPDRIGLHIGYDEALAHKLEAGADMFLMPSRFEPCGLNQIYSLRYGALPVVRRTGGLADTVIDATAAALQDGTATGFVFDEASPEALLGAIERALIVHQQPRSWRRMMTTAMRQDFSWKNSAAQYVALYEEMHAAKAPTSGKKRTPREISYAV